MLYQETFVSHSPEETEQWGRALAGRLGGVSAIALYGGLGCGKTALVRGLAKGLDCRDGVSSPTYTIVNEYRGKRRLCHFDLYRMEGEEALYEIGWEDYLASGALCAVEWSERAPGAFPPDTLELRLDKLDDHTRRITAQWPDRESC